MRVRATISFSGVISMAKGDERDITNDVLLKDLMRAGYVVALEEPAKQNDENTKLEEEDVNLVEQEKEIECSQTEEQEPKVATSQENKSTKKGVKSNEGK